MAIKRIRFKNATGGTVADGADGILLGTATNEGEYSSASVISGIRAGWIPNNAGAVSMYTTDIASPLDTGANAATLRSFRVDRAPGTFTIKLLAGLSSTGQYVTPNIRVLDADGTSVLFTQPGVSRNNDGLGLARQINTDGTMVAVGTSDPGQSITTVGTSFIVELTGGGSFVTRLSYLEYDDGVTGGSGLAAVLMRRRLG
jgi:hypothetical protein